MPRAYRGKFWDELMVGQEAWTGGRTVTEGDVLAFPGLTGDFNPLHVDEAFARTSPFKTRERASSSRRSAKSRGAIAGSSASP